MGSIWRRTTSRKPGAALLLILALSSCGSGGYDPAGLASGGADEAVFLRASQQYFRGSLSASREGFSALAEGAASPLAEDAALAVRAIDRELAGLPDTLRVPDVVATAAFPPLALVGRPQVAAEMEKLNALLTAAGCTVLRIEDAGAADMTLVLYPEGSQTEARRVADSLEAWLSTPALIGTQPGDNVIPTVAPGHGGIVIVLGSDALVERTPSGSPVPLPGAGHP